MLLVTNHDSPRSITTAPRSITTALLHYSLLERSTFTVVFRPLLGQRLMCRGLVAHAAAAAILDQGCGYIK